MTAKPRVLMLGGGFAALETAFLLRMRMRDEVDLDARVRQRLLRL